MTAIKLNNYAQWQANSMYKASFAGRPGHKLLRSVRSWLGRQGNMLTNYQSYIEKFHVCSQKSAGLQLVALDKINGSISRSGEFTMDFRPIAHHTRERWLAIAKIHVQGRALPPVMLYEVNGQYFVVDGHHRISVAKAAGQVDIEAVVTRINVSNRAPVLQPAFA